MQRNFSRLFAASLLLAAVAAACNGSGEADTAGESGAPVATQTVTLKDSLYKPADIVISAGQTVTWVWEDGSVPHDVVSQDDSEKFQTKLQTSGTFTHTFSKPGRYSYYCTIHPRMRGTVRVS